MTGRRRAVGGVIAIAALLLSGCSLLPGEPKLKDVPVGASDDDLCLILQAKLVDEVFPGKTMWPDEQPAEFPDAPICSFQPDVGVGLIKVTIINRDVAMSDVIAVNKAAASKDSDTCTQGAELPEFTMGGDVETTLLCRSDDLTTFDYTGRFPSGALNFRVIRATDDERITIDEAKAWLADVVERVSKLK